MLGELVGELLVVLVDTFTELAVAIGIDRSYRGTRSK